MRRVLDIPPDLEPVAGVVAEALERVVARFDLALESDVAPVRELCAHVERYRGKMLRPILALVSGLASSPEAEGAFASGDAGSVISGDLVTVAAVCEMVHMATLVHDDVLDEAGVRRRGQTVNALHGNEPAVILGDYLIASAYALSASVASPEVSRAVARASQIVCAGELLQLHNRENFALDEPTYFEIIARKTGELTAVSCELGAMTAGASDADRAVLRDYGLTIGSAFQIQDDLLDFAGTEEGVGKSVHKDLEKGKLTLPLIHHLGAATGAQRERSLGLLEAASQGEDTAAALAQSIRATGSIEYASDTARGLVERAKTRVGELPGTPARGVLEKLADAVVNRSY